MAILCSDDFAGITLNAAITGRTLNNALGGSGLRTWENTGSVLRGNGDDTLNMNVTGARAMVDLGTQTAFRASCRFTANTASGQNFRVSGRLDSLSEGSENGVMAYLSGGNSLRIRERVGGSNSDRATKSVTAINTSLWYRLVLEMNGLAWKAELRDASDSLIDSVTYTASSSPSGSYYGFGSWQTPPGSLFDSWLFETLDAPPPAAVRSRVIGPF